MPVSLTTEVQHSPVRMERAQFAVRSACVCCHSRDLRDVWSGLFSDPVVRNFLAQFHYAADTQTALAGSAFRLVQCTACDMMFHQQVLTDPWLTTLYGEWIDSRQIDLFESRMPAERRATARFDRARQRVKHLLRLKQLLKSKTPAIRVLDFGCGDGEFLNMASLFGFASYGIDFSITRVERQQHRQITVAPSLQELDMLEVGPFDVITLFETLEHVTDPGSLLRALHERLAPRGILIVEVPNCEGLSIPRNLDEFHALQPLEHINNFTPQTLQTMCERHGFVRIAKPAAHVTTSLADVARTLAGRLIRPRNTQQVFRKR
jgi:2-polyprenyl-3-methyl-5-hydroxy-6-metoxy-1,4-benzoquinol methylase